MIMYSDCMPTNKEPVLAMSEKRRSISLHSREGLKFPPGPMDSNSRPSRRHPMVGDHNLRAVKETAPVDREHGQKKNLSGANNLTELPAQRPVHNSPRHERGRSSERSTKKRGSAVRSSSYDVLYSNRDDTKPASGYEPLNDVMKALKDDGHRATLSQYIESHKELKAECDSLKYQVSMYKLKLCATKDLDESKKNWVSDFQQRKLTRTPQVRFLENVSEKIRPTTLVECFKELESTEWLKVKESMDKLFGEDDQGTFLLLCNTLTVAFQFAREQIQELYHHQNDILRGLLPSEVSGIAKAHSQTKSIEEEADQLPKTLRNMLRNRWRSDADKCSIQQLEKKTVSVLSKTHEWQFKEIGDDRVFGQYLSACCRLAWQMNIMQPPMHVSVEGGFYNERNHRVFYTCERSPNARIRFYVWPSLYDCNGGNLLQPGLVYLDKSRRTEQHKTHMRSGIPLLDNRRR